MRRRWTGRPRRNEFAPVSCELLVALASTKLTDRAHRVVLAIIATSYGRYRGDVDLNRAELASLTGLDHSNVSRALTELEDRGIVVVEQPSSRGKRARLELRTTYGLWEPALELDRSAEATFRSVPTPRDRVEEHVHEEPIDRSGYRHGATVSRNTPSVSSGNVERVDEHGRPRVKGGSEKNPQSRRTVNGPGPIAPARAGAPEAGPVDRVDVDADPALGGAAGVDVDPLTAAPRPVRARGPLSPNVEHALEMLLSALPDPHGSRRAFFSLAYRGASEADFHDARTAIAVMAPTTNVAGYAFRCIDNRLNRPGVAR